ncbi:carboxymuconolactone decarboxylase family protein [Brachybacterium subflavum]|uniref:carboxymuconolactone decarboxylase family protein n=1 Tax=Brachybacterium subflavum TaxID=2585206 RepID=UPI0012660BA9|nr:carboxymuconolactone decarboxylase family protein [Brachybacterium subflavum]
MTRMKLFETHPEGYKAVLGLESYCSRRLPRELYEIVKLRASILNGCSFCTDMHSRDGIEAGIPAPKLFGVAAWHESPHFDDRERAALRLTDAVTKLGPDGVPDDIWDEAAAQFDEPLLGDLLFAIATINVWNRLAIPTRLEPQA